MSNLWLQGRTEERETFLKAQADILAQEKGKSRDPQSFTFELLFIILRFLALEDPKAKAIRPALRNMFSAQTPAREFWETKLLPGFHGFAHSPTELNYLLLTFFRKNVLGELRGEFGSALIMEEALRINIPDDIR